MKAGRSRELADTMLRRGLIAGVSTGVVVVVYARLTAPIIEGQSRVVSELMTAALFVFIMAVFGPLTFHLGRRRFLPEWAWLDEDREPTAAERDAVLSQPWRMTLFALWIFVAVAVVSTVAQIVVGTDWDRAIIALVAPIVAGLATCSFVYLLAERTLRPYIAEALAGTAPTRPATLGIRPRFLLAWALASGIPLLAIALTPIVRADDAGFTLAVPVVFLAIVGLCAGLLVTREAARSVAEPMEQVRAGLLAVRDGDIETTVTVDDGGEVGLVQSGFNQMVAGLRERKLLEDLFGRHVGEDVARLALAGGTGLGGEVREVSVFFVDLTGSTAIATSRPATDVVAMLNRFFELVVESATEEGGWVNKFEGDGALCVFGAPVDQPDHAARAARAARRLGARLAELALDAGIGVSSGDVVAGNVGAAQRYEYTVIGHPVNEAARLTEAAKRRSSRLMASQAAITAAADEAINWSPAGEIELRGLPGCVPVYEPATTASSGPA